MKPKNKCIESQIQRTKVRALPCLARVLVFLIKCILLQVCNAQDLISVWTSDTKAAMDAQRDMGLSNSVITQRFLNPRNNTIDTVISNNDVRYFLATNGDIGSSPSITFLTSTLVIRSAITNNLESYIMFQTGEPTPNVFLINRTISSLGEIPSNFNSRVGVGAGAVAVVPDFKSQFQSLSINCFDARTIDTVNPTSILIICKATTAGFARIIALSYQLALPGGNPTWKKYESADYENNKISFQTISWSYYSRSMSASAGDTYEGIIIITDTYKKGAEQFWGMWAGAFVTKQSSREFNISLPMQINYATQGQGGALVPFSVLPQTHKIFIATVSNAIISTPGFRTTKNLLMVGFSSFIGSPSPTESYLCWEDSSGPTSIIDRMISLDKLSTTMMFKCGPQIPTIQPNSLQSMGRIAKLANDSDYFLRVSYNNNAAAKQNDEITINIFYSIIKIQPVQINVGTMSLSYLEKTILTNTIVVPAPFNLYPVISSAVENKVFYTCWRDYSSLDTIGTPCQVLDYFWVNSTAYIDDKVDIANIFPLIKREMGPLSTVAFDYDPSTNMSYQMAMVPEFQPTSSIASLTRKVISIYNLSRAQFSVVVPPSAQSTDYVRTIEFPDIKIPNQPIRTQKVSYQNGPQNVWLNYGNLRMWIPFKASQPTSVGYFRSNTFFNNNNPLFLSTTEAVPSSFRMYRFELTATPAQSGDSAPLVLLIDRIWVELYKKSSKYFIHTRSFNIMADPSKNYAFTIAGSWSQGTWSSSDALFSQTNFKKMENFASGGLFLYFESSGRYGIVRMDTVNPDITSFRISTNPMLMFETKSTVIILTILNMMGPFLQLQQLDDSVARNISSNVSAISKNITQNEIGSQLKIKRMDDLSLEIYNTGQTVSVNILAEVDSKLDIIMVSRISWTNRTTGISTANFLDIEYQKVLDLPFSNAARINYRCIYNSSVVFLDYSSTKKLANLHVYNLTKRSFFSLNYNNVDSVPTLTCMGEIIAISYITAGVKKTDLVTIQGELRAVNRIRDSTTEPTTTSISPYAYSRFSTSRIIGLNKILLVQHEMTNVYMNMNYPLVIPNVGETLRGAKQLVLNNFMNSDMITKPIQMETYLLLKPEHIQGSIIYIGNETLEDQKKILYEANLKKTYQVEDQYRIPTTLFDVNMITSDLSKIQVLKRLREINTQFNLWNDSTTTSTTNLRCNFSLRGIEDISIINDIMLRVDSRDDGFCMEISRIVVGDSLQIIQSDYMIQQGASVTDCRLNTDKSFTNTTGWESIRNSGPGLNFVITCIYSEKEKNYLWALFINVQPVVQNIFKPKTNLLRMEIKHKFTYYKAIFVNNYLYFAFYDSSSRQVYYIRDLINTLDLDSSKIIEQSYSSTGFELTYFPPSSPTDRAQTGIWLLFAYVTLNASMNNVETYGLSSMRILSSGSIGALNGDNTLKWNNMYFNQSIGNISCASMAYPNGSINLMSCAYNYMSSRNVMFYTFSPFPNPASTSNPLPTPVPENYVTPYGDFEIRQLKVFYWDGIFSYITINFSPTTGKKYLMMYRHDINQTDSLKANTLNASVYMNSSLLIYGTIDLSNSSMDLNKVELNYFTIGTSDVKTYIGINDEKYLRIFQVAKIEITIDSNIQFSQISNSKLSYIDHMGRELTSYSLDSFFRQKKGFTMLFVWVLLSSLGLAGVLVALYLTFRKKSKIDESQASLKELRGLGSDRKSDLNCSINFEAER